MQRVWGIWANDKFVNEFVKDLIQNSDINNIKWRFDNKGIGSDQNLLKRKIKEALKSTEGLTIIENLTSSGSDGANKVKELFYNDLGIDGSKIDGWIDLNFNIIFAY